MTFNKLRRQIACQAARLMYDRQESEYYTAKVKAARRICRGGVKPKDLPSNAEIRDEIQLLAMMHEGESRTKNLRDMRIHALRMMQLLRDFHPRLIGSVFTGHIREGSDIDLHLFADGLHSVTNVLDYEGMRYETQQKRVVKNGEATTYRHVHVYDCYPFELTVYPLDKRSFNFKSSITGKAIEKASIPQLEQFLASEYPDLDIEHQLEISSERLDRFELFYALMLPLERVNQDPKYHPEGDALYHSLQVYDLACDRLPYDEEFLLAALLHDVGKGIDRYDHVASGLQAVHGFITPRTGWLIAHHMEAHKIFERAIGARAHRRLRENEDYDELVMLGECDRGGRERGVEVTDLQDALDYIREVSSTFDY